MLSAKERLAVGISLEADEYIPEGEPLLAAQRMAKLGYKVQIYKGRLYIQKPAKEKRDG
jgi:hypothetical protein